MVAKGTGEAHPFDQPEGTPGLWQRGTPWASPFRGHHEGTILRGVKKGKERGGCSFQKFLPPSEVAPDNPLKKQRHDDSEETQSDKDKWCLDNLDPTKAAGVLRPRWEGRLRTTSRLQKRKSGRLAGVGSQRVPSLTWRRQMWKRSSSCSPCLVRHTSPTTSPAGKKENCEDSHHCTWRKKT